MKTQVKLNAVDISSSRLTTWKIVETSGKEIKDCIINTTYGVFTDISDLRSGHPITIKRGLTTSTDSNEFDGYIDRIDKQGPEVTIYGKDKLIDLIKASVTYTYDGISFPSTESKGSDIAKDLIETHGGLTAEVVDTGEVLVLKKFICNGTDVLSRLQILADIYDYQIYYDASDSKVHFEPKGYTSGNTLYVGGANNNVSNLPKWVEDNTQCVNKLTVKGAVQEVQDDVFFDGDGLANQIFTLAKKPIAVQVWEDVAGTLILKVPGVEDSTSGTYDYNIDKETKKLSATDNWSPAIGSKNVKVTYTNAIPVPVRVEDTASQSKYGIYENEKFFSDIQTVDDSEKRGNAWLSKYSEPFITIPQLIPKNVIDYEAGQKVRVTDILNDEDRDLVIGKITKKFPHKGDELTLGDKEYKLADWGMFTIERIRRLEEENQKNTDLIISIKNLPNSVRYYRRYIDAYRKTIDADGFIVGHPNYDVVGVNKLGSAFSVGEVLIRRVWKDQKYIENFYDEDFKGVGDANWNLVDKQLEF